MARIGKKTNYVRESQAHEQENNDHLVTLHHKTDGGISSIDLTLEPTKINALGDKCRLSFDEYCDAINGMIENEEEEWHELRMKDQINLTRDRIIESTILKYAKQHHNIDTSEFNGRDINYIKRYDEKGRFLGEATVVSLTMISEMNIKVNK